MPVWDSNLQSPGDRLRDLFGHGGRNTAEIIHN